MAEPVAQAPDFTVIAEQDVLLLDETREGLGLQELKLRRELGARVLAAVPVEAVDRLQILQPAIGCLNSCNFCSQVAGPVTSELDADSLRSVMGGVRGAMRAMDLERVGGARSHKDGVIFPYLDNDIGSYPHLPDYLVGMRSLGGRTRISTVGWSRHNPDLQAMHERIAAKHVDDIDGIRFSLTPYTLGWRTNRAEYLDDFSNALATYRPLFDQKGFGRRTACIEMRFVPDVTIDELQERTVGTFTLVRCGNYTLVTPKDQLAQQNRSAIARMGATGPELNQEGVTALQLMGDTSHLDERDLRELMAAAQTDRLHTHAPYGVMAQRGSAHTFANADGPYYCFNPLKTEDNTFSAVHYYPQTEQRPVSGVLDATRPLLNNLMRFKEAHGIGPRDDYDAATVADIHHVVTAIQEEADTLRQYSPRRAEYIDQQVLPLVRALVTTLNQSGLSPADFFRYGLVVDTGVIVNQGKALHEFGGLASRPDMPMTPNEEKGYGDVSQSSIRGNTWRMSPVVAVAAGAQAMRGYGRKSLPLVGQAQDGLLLGVYEWNPQTFANNDTAGERLRSIPVPIGDLIQPMRRVTPGVGNRNHLLPGTAA